MRQDPTGGEWRRGGPLRGTPQFAARIAAGGALASAAIAVVLLLFTGGRGYELTAEFENASQLVGGEVVDVGGVGVGTVKRVELAADGRALVRLAIDEGAAPLPEGTTATIRSTSLAGIANRRVELRLPTEASGEIPDGGRLGAVDTVAEVDLDEVLNTLDPPAVRDLKRVIRGLERAGRGAGPQANRGLRYLNPLMSASRRVLAELGADRDALRRLLADGARLSSAVAARGPELSSSIANLDVALGAAARQRSAITRAVRGLPRFLERGGLVLSGLREAAGDLEPLAVASLPVARRLRPFFSDLRAASADAVPAITDLNATIRRPGVGNDLIELVRLSRPLRDAAVGSGSPECGDDPSSNYGAAADGDFTQGALGEARCALANSRPVLAHFRPYSPDLLGWFDDFSTTGTLDANGGIGRIAGTHNVFSASATNGLPELLSPIDPDVLFGTGGSGPIFDVGNNSRCPGANERDPGDGTTPYTEGGSIFCDPSQIPVGP